MPNADKTIIHIDAQPAEVDACYKVATGLLGDIGENLRGIALRTKPRGDNPFKAIRKAVIDDRAQYSDDQGFPVKPQKILWDLRQALGPSDIVISDVGAHKMWTSRMYKAEAEHLHHFERLCFDGIGVRARSRPSSRTRIEKLSPSPATRDS